ncbi:MAG TPA: redoxin family protein [Candidatus Acidoferrales bacterium]|nr:redoxin family protein [Candidatus Acidoferrales bacterium]
MKRKLFTGVMLGAVAGLLVLFASPSYKEGMASPAGSMAKEFSFQLDGKSSSLADLRGKVVVLNFWASWCPPCVDETASLNQLQQWLVTRGGTILSISADTDPGAYEQFLKDHSVIFPTYRDPVEQGRLSQIGLAYGTSMYPETYIIDRRGRIARKIIGEQNWTSPQMTAYLNSVLAAN